MSDAPDFDKRWAEQLLSLDVEFADNPEPSSPWVLSVDLAACSAASPPGHRSTSSGAAGAPCEAVALPALLASCCTPGQGSISVQSKGATPREHCSHLGGVSDLNRNVDAGGQALTTAAKEWLVHGKDANTLLYHFTAEPRYGGACTELVERIENQEILGFTSTHVVSEVAHRLMTLEASLRFSRPFAGIAPWRKKHPAEIHQLAQFRLAIQEVPRHHLCKSSSVRRTCSTQRQPSANVPSSCIMTL